MGRFINVIDNDECKNQMQSGKIARVLGMTQAVGYQGKGKSKATGRAKVDEEISSPKPSRHEEGR